MLKFPVKSTKSCVRSDLMQLVIVCSLAGGGVILAVGVSGTLGAVRESRGMLTMVSGNSINHTPLTCNLIPLKLCDSEELKNHVFYHWLILLRSVCSIMPQNWASCLRLKNKQDEFGFEQTSMFSWV